MHKYFIFRRIIMKLSAPKNVVFYISVILIVVGLVFKFFAYPEVGLFEFMDIQFWFVFIGGALLALGNLLKGL